MRERLLQLGANPSTTLVRPMGADMTAVRAVRAERQGGRVLFVGRLAEKKGVAVLVDGHSGLLVPPGDAEALAAAVRGCCVTPSRGPSSAPPRRPPSTPTRSRPSGTSTSIC
jgi:hypothetical protein